MTTVSGAQFANFTLSEQQKTLLALADRAHDATGPDRILDTEIAQAIGHYDYLARGLGDNVAVSSVTYSHEYDHVDVLVRSTDRTSGGLQYTDKLPPFTWNLDEARKLIPDGWRIMLIGEWDHQALRHKPWQAILSRRGTSDSLDPSTKARCDFAVSPALALVSAALRARARSA